MANDSGAPSADNVAAAIQPLAPPMSQPASVATWKRNGQGERLA